MVRPEPEPGEPDDACVMEPVELTEGTSVALLRRAHEVADMVVLAANRILGREISPEQHRALIEESLNEAGSELHKN